LLRSSTSIVKVIATLKSFSTFMNVSVPRYDRAYSHAEKLVFYEKSKVLLFL